MANLQHTPLAVLLGRATAFLVALAVVVAVGMAATCPWLCDGAARGAAGGGRCDAPLSLAHHDARVVPPAPPGQPRWHAGDKL
jgi:hypothetical protein